MGIFGGFENEQEFNRRIEFMIANWVRKYQIVQDTQLESEPKHHKGVAGQGRPTHPTQTLKVA